MNREQKAIIDDASPDRHTISSGVPQGSILGPFFFVIFIIDLPDAVSSWNMVALYADDCQTSGLSNVDTIMNHFRKISMI